MWMPYPRPYGQGQLVINMSKPFGALAKISPRISIDGYPAPARWERNAYPVVPGRHQVRASVSYRAW